MFVAIITTHVIVLSLFAYSEMLTSALIAQRSRAQHDSQVIHVYDKDRNAKLLVESIVRQKFPAGQTPERHVSLGQRRSQGTSTATALYDFEVPADCGLLQDCLGPRS